MDLVFDLVLAVALILFAAIVFSIERRLRLHTHDFPPAGPHQHADYATAEHVHPPHEHPQPACTVHRLALIATETVNDRNVDVSKCKTCGTIFRDEAP